MRINFMVVGAQKCGTTALAHFLSQHPDICHSPKKELHFFDAKDFNDAATNAQIEADYHRRFTNYSGQPLVGESTPIYMFLPEVPPRLYRYNPALKLIILLRNPVERAISQYHMVVERRREKRSMGVAFVLEFCAPTLKRLRVNVQTRERNYFARGLYSHQIKHLLRYFNRDQILILRSEQLRQNHGDALKRVYEFLGVEVPQSSSGPTLIGAGKYLTPTPWILKLLLRLGYLQEITRLENLLGWNLKEWR